MLVSHDVQACVIPAPGPKRQGYARFSAEEQAELKTAHAPAEAARHWPAEIESKLRGRAFVVRRRATGSATER